MFTWETTLKEAYLRSRWDNLSGIWIILSLWEELFRVVQKNVKNETEQEIGQAKYYNQFLNGSRTPSATLQNPKSR